MKWITPSLRTFKVMTALLIFCGYLLLDKLIDAGLTFYNLKCQHNAVQATAEPEEEEEERVIGFNNIGNNLREVGEDE